MAKFPPHDDDKNKKTDAVGKRPGEFKSPKTPRPEDTKAPKTPRPSVPNFSLDDEPEEVFEAAEVIEEAGPTSDEAADVLLDDEPASAKSSSGAKTPRSSSASDVFLGEDEPEDAEPIVPASEVFEAGEIVEEAEPIEEATEAEEVFGAEEMEVTEPSAVLGKTQPWPPKSEPDLNALFEEPSAAEEVEEAEEFAEEAVMAEDEVEVAGSSAMRAEPSAMLSGVEPAGEVVTAPAWAQIPAEHVIAGDAVTPPVDEVAHPSGVAADVPGIDEIAHASDVVASGEVAVTAPMSDVVASDEVIEQGVPDIAGSQIVAAHEPIENAVEPPAWPVPATGAMPSSDVLAAEEAEEFAEAAPASDVFAAEEVEAVEAVSAMESDVFAAEEVEAVEAASAVEAEEVFDAEEADAMPASAIDSGAFAEEVAEFEEEAVDAEVAGPISGSSSVLPVNGKKSQSGSKTSSYEQTIAFEGPPSSAAKRPDSDVLVTEEEVVGGGAASAVDLGEMPKKGSSVTGIDKVAEALESGTDLGGDVKAAPSVEFDELLDDLSDSDEHEAAKAVDVDGSTEMDAGVIEEDFESVKPAAKKDAKKDKRKKKDKASAKATGDDIDLDDVFADSDEGEAVEAADAEEGEALEAADAEEEAAAVFDDDPEDVAAESADAEAEAAGVFKDEAEAAEAEATDDDELADFGDDDDAKAKKGKKGHKKDEDEEDEEEDSAAKKKKGKKEKTRAATEPAKGGSGILGWVGGMFVAGLLLVGAFAAALFVAPDSIRGVLDMADGGKPGPVIPKDGGGGGGGKKKEKIDEARGALAQGEYKTVFTTLEGASDPAELAVLGEARWLEDLQEQEAKKELPSRDAPAVKQALADLQKSSNKLLAKQIETQLGATTKEKDLSEQLNTMMMERNKVEKQLTVALAAKTTADKAMDAVADVLVNSKLIADKSKFDVASLDKIFKGLGNDKAALDKLNAVLDKEVKKTGEAGLMEILASRDQADKNLAAVNKALEGANVKDKDAKGVQELASARDNLQTEIKGLDALLAQAIKEFSDGNILPPNADPRKQLVEGAKLARVKAESPLSIPLANLGMSLGGIGSGTSKLVEEVFGVAKTATELKWYQAREQFIQSPQDKMNFHIAVLQDRTRNNPAELKAILLEADWVLNPDSKSSPEARAKAQYVKALALRNQEKYAEARTSFEQTLKAASDDKDFKELLTRSHKELSDSSYYYLPRVDRLQAEGNYPAALAELDAAIKAIPGDGRLYARRALIRLDSIRSRDGKLSADDDKSIRADAESAAKDEKAEAAFLIGLLEEVSGKWDVAVKQYKLAIQLHDEQKRPADEAGRYRVALGRLLLRDRTEAAPALPQPKIEEKKDVSGDQLNVNPTPSVPQASAKSWRAEFTSLVQSLTILAATQPDIDDKDTFARLKDVMDEAEKLKASKNPKLQGQGYCLMGSAMSKMGRRTEGLREYAKGLELLYPGIETKEINELIESHPAFQQPDSSGVANPIMAERHFGEGSHLFWKAMTNPKAATALQDFKDAEGQFLQAIKYYDKDARYQYYLGLSLLQQKSRDKRDSAIFAFEKGARLEASTVQSNPFATREINQSLERIQGEMRELLNQYRYRPATEPETKKTDPE